jgi:hypothetical protein
VVAKLKFFQQVMMTCIAITTKLVVSSCTNLVTSNTKETKMFCRFCNQPCEHEFCNETCYQEYQHDLAEFLDGIKDEYPGESQYNDDPPVWDVQGGL